MRRLRQHFLDAVRHFREPIVREDFFTGRLAPELRLEIYQYALCSETPIRLQRQPRRRGRLSGIGILSVSRLINAEALPVLYKLNTIAVYRSEFCQFTSPQLVHFKPELLQKLYIRDLQPISKCPMLQKHSWHTKQQTCCNCDPNMMGLFATLLDMPRLKEVCVNYHGYSESVHALTRVVDGTDYSVLFRLTCIGVGQYRLDGRLLGNVKISLCDEPLVKLWPKVLDMTCLDYIGRSSSGRAMDDEFRLLETRYRKMELSKLLWKLCYFVWTCRDKHKIPRRFGDVWPSDIQKDLRHVNDYTDRPDFLHSFNVQLQSVLASGTFAGTRAEMVDTRI